MMKCKFCGRPIEVVYDVRHVVHLVDPEPVAYRLHGHGRKVELFDAEEDKFVKAVEAGGSPADGRGFCRHECEGRSK